MLALLANPWKAAALAAGAVAALLGLTVFLYRIELKSVRAERDSIRIEAQSLRDSLDQQNEAVAALKRDSDARVTAATVALAEAQRASRKAQDQAAVLLGTPPKGSTVCERMEDVDARVLESLK